MVLQSVRVCVQVRRAGNFTGSMPTPPASPETLAYTTDRDHESDSASFEEAIDLAWMLRSICAVVSTVRTAATCHTASRLTVPMISTV